LGTSRTPRSSSSSVPRETGRAAVAWRSSPARAAATVAWSAARQARSSAGPRSAASSRMPATKACVTAMRVRKSA